MTTRRFPDGTDADNLMVALRPLGRSWTYDNEGTTCWGISDDDPASADVDKILNDNGINYTTGE
jgi:hypothetical protein